MMKFTDGKMPNAPGLKVHDTQKLWELEAGEDYIRAMVPCKQIDSLFDITRGVMLTVEFTSPRKNIIQVRATHFFGGLDRGPHFQLNTENAGVTVERGDGQVTMTSGRLSVVVPDEGPFQYRFYWDGAYVTGNENGDMAYITHMDYEADRWCDFNAMELPEGFHDSAFVRERLGLHVGEYIYGLGERFTPFVKNGQNVEIWNKDGGTVSEQGYKNIPFYLSSRGYGLLVNHPEKVGFRIGTDNVRKVQFAVEGEELCYQMIGGGSPKAVLEHYTALTGRTPIPPAWSFGLWLSTSWTTDYDQETVLSMIKGMQEREIPLSVFHYDSFWMRPYHLCDFRWQEKFGNVKQMLTAIKETGVKVCVWINPYISQQTHLFREGKERGYLLKKPDGSVWQSDYFTTGLAIVDFTNPEAAAWWASKLEELIDQGVDCFKTDFGERIPTQVRWHDGSDPKKMHNYYPYLYNKTVFELLKRKKGEDEACVFARSATVGTQQFPVNWGGDNAASYVSMAESLRGGLSFCSSGFGFWSHDIGGFELTATPDLYKRWSAFGMLSTHSRFHGKDSYRVPWNFDEESVDVLRRFAGIKCRLMPYLYQAAAQVHEKGVPAMRPMFLEFPADPACSYLDRQYMLGGSLLVAPIFSETGEVTYYLPEAGGKWTNYITGEEQEGGRWHTGTFDYFSMPLMVRPGTVLPVGVRSDDPVYQYEQDVIFHLYQLQDGVPAECTVCDNKGKAVLRVTALRSGGAVTVKETLNQNGAKWSALVVGTDTLAGIQPGETGLTLSV